MARITIKDLPQSDELDRKAMSTIVGGARAGGRPIAAQAATQRGDRIVDYPPGCGRDKPAPSNGQPPGA